MPLPFTFSSDPTQEQAFLKRFQSLAAARSKRGEADIGEARAEALRRGLTGDAYEGAAVSEARAGVGRDISDIEAGLGAESARTELENTRLAEARKYGTSEREAGQVFGAGEAEKSRIFGAKESELGRGFQEKMLGIQQGFSGTQAEYDRATQADLAKRSAREGRLSNLIGAGTYLGGQLIGAKAGTALGAKLGAFGGPAGMLAGAALGAVAAKPISKLAKKLCFLGNTLIEMKDGSRKRIDHLVLGDETLGGKVVSVRMSYGSDIYDLGGVKVTGSHAVLEGGKWIRVASSNYSKLLDIEAITYSIVTTGHRVFSKGVEFADEFETDNYERYTDVESLDYLNYLESKKGVANATK